MSRGVLRCTQVVLLLLLLGLALVRRSHDYWPIVTWPVYSLMKPELPRRTKVVLEARVTTRSGETHVLRASDLVDLSRDGIPTPVLVGAAAPDEAGGRRTADRAHLARLVALALGHERFDAIEIWSVEWQVDPLARPPLDRTSPSAEIRRAHFTIATLK